MQDESLIEEMREALKGDRERAEARRHKPRLDESRVNSAQSPDPAGRPRQSFLSRLGLRRRQS